MIVVAATGGHVVVSCDDHGFVAIQSGPQHGAARAFLHIKETGCLAGVVILHDTSTLTDTRWKVYVADDELHSRLVGTAPSPLKARGLARKCVVW